MIGTTLEQGSRARDSNVRSLAFFLAISVLAHGAFFTREWLFLGAGFAFLQAWTVWSSLRTFTLRTLTLTDGLFFALVSLSFVGLWHPVKVSEGYMDVLRWGTLWMVYHQGRGLRSEWAQEKMLHWIEGTGVFIAAFAWLPRLILWAQGQGVSPISSTGTERLASLMGYPNALAVYLAAVLLLHPRSRWVQALLLLTLLNTGSRAAISLFVFVWCVRQFIPISRQKKVRGVRGLKIFTNRKIHERVLLGLVLFLGTLLTLKFNGETIQHLLNWGIRNSLGERLLYFRDGIKLAWIHQGIPQAGGWFAFPIVQEIPYWTTDPHSVLIHVLLNQGVYGLLALALWGAFFLRRFSGENESPYGGGFGSLNRGDKGLDILSALFFLGLHAMVDADFLFGTLGILFWILLGLRSQTLTSKLQFTRAASRRSSTRLFIPYILGGLRGAFFFLLGLGILGAWVYPQWLEPQTNLEQEWLRVKGNKQQALQILQEGLAVDQTQLSVRREIAGLELELHGVDGIPAVEEVLAWEKFDIRAYEWAQGLVLREAEKRRATEPSQAKELYQWSEKLPSRLDGVASVSAFEKKLWSGAINFQPSELMKLLASTAKERQLTLQ